MNIIDHLEWIEEPRTDVNIKHNLIEVLFLTLSAVLSGADGWKSIQEFGELQLDWLGNIASSNMAYLNVTVSRT